MSRAYWLPTIVVLVLLAAGCSDISMFAPTTQGEVQVEVRSLNQGGTVKAGEGLVFHERARITDIQWPLYARTVAISDGEKASTLSCSISGPPDFDRHYSHRKQVISWRLVFLSLVANSEAMFIITT